MTSEVYLISVPYVNRHLVSMQSKNPVSRLATGLGFSKEVVRMCVFSYLQGFGSVQVKEDMY